MKTDPILKLLSEGKVQAEIAVELNISLSTVEKLLNAQKKFYGAKTLFQLSVILCKKGVL